MPQKTPPKLTKELYAEILALWLERPSVRHVSAELGLPQALVRQVATEGVPSLDLEPLPPAPRGQGRTRRAKHKVTYKPSSAAEPDMSLAAATVIATQEAEQYVAHIKGKLRSIEDQAQGLSVSADLQELEQEADGTLAELDAAHRRAELEEQRIANVSSRAIAADNTKRSAQEAAVARMGLQHCLTLGSIYGHLAERMLTMIEDGRVEWPTQVSPRMVVSLAGALDKLTSATERAIKIDKGKAGEPDKVLGVQVGIILDGCTDDELEVVASTGRLPPRLKLLDGAGE